VLNAKGAPRQLFRTLLFHANGKPRGMFRSWVMREKKVPHALFAPWMRSADYQKLPKAVRVKDLAPNVT